MTLFRIYTYIVLLPRHDDYTCQLTNLEKNKSEI